jgi:ABC-type transport system involved in multi-copper enzyme maturation permease subunit
MKIVKTGHLLIIISLVAITIICFAVSYTVFMRQEIRSL